MSRAKRTRSDLALYGGAPAFPSVLHVGRPNIPDRTLLDALFAEVLDSGWLTNDGPMVRRFEDRIASMLGVRHCVAVCNGTIGLEIATRALELTGEVVIPSFTFVATAHCLQWQGIRPVFCDIDPVTGCLDPAKAEALLSPATTGILGVHLWGRPCDTEALRDLADRHGLRVVYDAAHALRCTSGGVRIGGFGDAEVFSFHATKFLSTMEGGAITTGDDALAEKMRLMRNFGFKGLDQVIHVGTNGKMAEMCAAFGLAALEGIDDVIARNRENWEAYAEGFRGIPGLTLRGFDPAEEHNYQYVVAEIDAEAFGTPRDRLVEILHAENVRVRRYFHPCCHRMEPYATLYPGAGAGLPSTEALSGRVVCFPTGTSVTDDDIAAICSIVGAVPGLLRDEA